MNLLVGQIKNIVVLNIKEFKKNIDKEKGNLKMKICKKCNIEKDLIFFSKLSIAKDGLNSRCKECRNKSLKEFRSTDEYAEWERRYRNNNKEKIKCYKRRYHKKHVKALYLKSSKYRSENKDKMKEYSNLYYKDRLKVDILFRISHSIRSLICKYIKGSGYKKNTKSEKILGCSFIEFKSYLESKFEPWMSWENYGKYNGEINYGWDIDHIIPISSVKVEEDVIKLNHYTNLRPLCSFTNRYIKKDNF